MKVLLPGIIVLVLLAGSVCLEAQTNTPASANPMISFLTPAQQEEYAKARATALENNPKLKADGEALLKQAAALTADSPVAEQQAVMEKMNSHRQKLRQAMLKADPNLGPIFTEIDQHLSQLKAAQSGQTPGSSSTTTPPTSSSTGH